MRKKLELAYLQKKNNEQVTEKFDWDCIQEPFISPQHYTSRAFYVEFIEEVIDICELVKFRTEVDFEELDDLDVEIDI